MKKKRENVILVSYIYEGKTEKETIPSIINVIYKCRKFRTCNRHTHLVSGTVSDNILDKKIPVNCCHTFLIMDIDDQPSTRLEYFKKQCKNSNSTLILSNPCIEINWLAAFKDVSNKIWDKHTIKCELKKYLGIGKKDNFDKIEVARKVINKLKNEPSLLAQWESNLYSLKTKTENNNFYDLIELIK